MIWFDCSSSLLREVSSLNASFGSAPCRRLRLSDRCCNLPSPVNMSLLTPLMKLSSRYKCDRLLLVSKARDAMLATMLPSRDNASRLGRDARLCRLMSLILFADTRRVRSEVRWVNHSLRRVTRWLCERSRNCSRPSPAKASVSTLESPLFARSKWRSSFRSTNVSSRSDLKAFCLRMRTFRLVSLATRSRVVSRLRARWSSSSLVHWATCVQSTTAIELSFSCSVRSLARW